MQCLGIDELPDINLINVKYNTEYGSIEFWEEIKTVKLQGMDKEVQIVSPYMKAWVFPTKEFLEYEMKKSMKNHEFPGSSEQKTERKNQEGPTAEERAMIKQNKGFMEKLKKITEKYNGNLDIVIQFKDYETNEIIFNLYAQVNENDILKMKPMLPEEVPVEDVRAEVDFKKIYDLIYTSQKEMSGQQEQYPPWDKKPFNPVKKVGEFVNGVKMYFKVQDIMNSAKVYPKESKKDVKAIAQQFFFMMKQGEGGGSQSSDGESNNQDTGDDKNTGAKEDVLQSESITGNVIFD